MYFGPPPQSLVTCGVAAIRYTHSANGFMKCTLCGLLFPFGGRFFVFVGFLTSCRSRTNVWIVTDKRHAHGTMTYHASCMPILPYTASLLKKIPSSAPKIGLAREERERHPMQKKHLFSLSLVPIPLQQNRRAHSFTLDHAKRPFSLA